MSRLHLTFAGLPEARQPHLSVDGMTPMGPNLSHWPGNRTPAAWKADLSTGICLRFARAHVDQQRAFLGEATEVLNDHYDTDGFLSLLAVLRPDVALARAERCLAAAATGDYQAFQTPAAFAIDRIVANLADDRSPIADEFAGLSGAEKSLARYRWLIDQAERVLDSPASLAPLYEEELRRIEEQLDRCLRGSLTRRVDDRIGLSVVATSERVERLVLNTLAGAWRVLHVQTADDDRGNLYRYHDRTESWFEVVTFTPPRRRDLRPLAVRLQALEGEPTEVRWNADAPTEPVPELWFGVPGTQAYGQVTRTLAPSRLGADEVAREVREFFAEAGKSAGG